MKVFHKTRAVFSLFFRAFGAYRWSIAGMAAFSVVSGVLEGVGITAIIPLFSVIVGGKASDSISRSIADFFAYLHLPFTAKFLLAFMIALFLAKTIFLFLSQQMTAQVNAHFERKIRSTLLRSTLMAKWPFLLSQKVGHLDQMLTTEVSSSSAILLYLSNGMLVVVNFFIYSILVFNISPVIATLTVFSGLVIFFIFLPLLQKVRITSDKMVRENKELAHYASEHIIGAKTLKSMRLEEPALNRGFALSEIMRKLYLRLFFLKNSTAALLQLAGIFFVIGLFVFLYKTSAFQFASFAVVVYALNKVFTNIQFAQSSAHAISMQVPYLESIMRYQDEATLNREQEGGSIPFSFEHELSFRDVDFMYHPGEPALSRLNLSIKKGEVVGLIGPSGAGKTTVVDLLLRLIEPKSGRCTLDGKEISSINLKEWRSHIGYMSQDVFLLNDTIANNIRFYDDSIAERDLVASAKMANIYEFVQSQPKKWETPVGERGVSLSGGERQRIALARVLARKPLLLILDEATSALDNESEAMIQKAIEELRGKTTIVIIAHRLSTVMISDRVVTLEEGVVIEEGSPSVLLKDTNSHFFKMYHAHQQ